MRYLSCCCCCCRYRDLLSGEIHSGYIRSTVANWILYEIETFPFPSVHPRRTSSILEWESWGPCMQNSASALPRRMRATRKDDIFQTHFPRKNHPRDSRSPRSCGGVGCLPPVRVVAACSVRRVLLLTISGVFACELIWVFHDYLAAASRSTTFFYFHFVRFYESFFFFFLLLLLLTLLLRSLAARLGSRGGQPGIPRSVLHSRTLE